MTNKGKAYTDRTILGAVLYNEHIPAGSTADEFVEQVLKDIEGEGYTVTVCYACNHTRDRWTAAKIKKYMAEHNGQCPYSEGDPVKDHIHVCWKTEEFLTGAKLQKILGDRGRVDYPKMRKKSMRWDGMAMYLVHAINPERHQYPIEDVMTLRGEEYGFYYAANIDRVLKEVGQRKQSDQLDVVMQRIRSGELMSKDDVLLDDEAYDVYYSSAKAKREIINALASAAERRCAQGAQETRDNKRVNQSLAIWGEPGGGKDVLADATNAVLRDVYGMSYGEAQDKHINETYAGEDIFLLRDIRNNTFTSPQQALLMLDEHRPAVLDGRNYGRGACAPKLFELTSFMPPLEVLHWDGEPDDQIIRRLTVLLQTFNPRIFGANHVRVFRHAYMSPELKASPDTLFIRRDELMDGEYANCGAHWCFTDMSGLNLYTPAGAIREVVTYLYGVADGIDSTGMLSARIESIVKETFNAAVDLYRETNGADGMPPLGAIDTVVNVRKVFDEYEAKGLVAGRSHVASWLNSGAPVFTTEGGVTNGIKLYTEGRLPLESED